MFKGLTQSPNNIHFAQVKKLNHIKDVLQIHYEPVPFTIKNTGFTIQTNPTNSNSYIFFGGNKYIPNNFIFIPQVNINLIVKVNK